MGVEVLRARPHGSALSFAPHSSGYNHVTCPHLILREARKHALALSPESCRRRKDYWTHSNDLWAVCLDTQPVLP